MSAPDWTKRQLMAEFIATSTFVWAGCGTRRCVCATLKIMMHCVCVMTWIVDESLCSLQFQPIIYY